MLINKRKVTIFYSRPEEQQIFNQVIKELKKKNFKVEFSTNLKKKADIGFYCESDSDPKNSNISAIFLGGLDQGRTIWPNIWKEQPWNKFDIGFLPGNSWAKRWKSCSEFKKTRTKHGVFNVGWPKSDFLFNKKNLVKIRKKIIQKYKINTKKINILYAPSFECFNRQLEVTKAAKINNYNLIIKHWLAKREKKFIDLWNNIKKSNFNTLKIYRNNSVIIKPYENFLSILDFSDLIITDESSVAYEGLIRNIPTLSVKDWMIARHNKGVERLVKPSSVTFKTTKNNLSSSMKKIINDKSVKKKLKVLLNKEISYLGKSSRIISEILEKYLTDKKSLTKIEYYIKPKPVLNNKITNIFNFKFLRKKNLLQ